MNSFFKLDKLSVVPSHVLLGARNLRMYLDLSSNPVSGGQSETTSSDEHSVAGKVEKIVSRHLGFAFLSFLSSPQKSESWIIPSDTGD